MIGIVLADDERLPDASTIVPLDSIAF